MKIFVPTRATISRMKTHLTLAGCDITWLVHTQEQGARLRDELGINPHKIHIHHVPEDLFGIATVRDYILENLVAPGEWYAAADDNIEYIHSVVPELYNDEINDFPERWEYEHPLLGLEVPPFLEELKNRCIQKGTVYGGFGWMENPFFRKSKWQSYGYVKAKLMVAKNDGRKWRLDPRVCVMSDHVKTFDTIATYGSVVVNRFVYVHHERFQPGGIGTYEQRLPGRTPTCDYIYEKFAGLVAPYKGVHDNPTITKRTQKSVDCWRKENGYIQ